MYFVIEKHQENTKILPAKLIDVERLKTATSPLAWKILKLLSENNYYPKEIGKKLKMHEQKIYYHIRRLEKAGLVKVVREDRIHGAITKYYSITEPALALTLKEMEPAQKLFSAKHTCREFLDPFIVDGRLNSIIVVGEQETHGRPARDVAHDTASSTNFALFLGTFLNHVPGESIKYDTELGDEDLKQNLIIIGGPGVNSIMRRVNSKLPIRFEKVKFVNDSKYKENYYMSFYSDISKKRYSQESYGIIVKTRNPFDKTKQILVIAGMKLWGTKAAVLAFLQKFDELCSRNSYDKKTYARVIDGLDLDGDGALDSVEFIE